MIVSAIITSTRIDAHGQKLSLENLQEMLRSIKNSPYAIPVSIEHDLKVMPKGKVIDACIIKAADGEYEIHIKQEIYEEIKEKYIPESKEKWYIVKSEIDNRPYKEELTNVEITNTTISIDQANFSPEDFKELMILYKNELSLDTKILIRKSLIPPPEIVFSFIAGTLFSSLKKKITEKISEEVINLVQKAILATKDRILRNSNDEPTTYVFFEKDNIIFQFIIVTLNPDDVFEALVKLPNGDVQDQIDSFRTLFTKDLTKVQFVYSIQEKKWKLHYANTVDGTSIGSEDCYQYNKMVIEKFHKNLIK
ncbi:MAG TPA: hypothetical protein VIG61_07520 [Fusobacterium sp.]|uniref:hypothetical protein n=1 Tax=Fusobacterium sp. TaxID=68766 RepID=UPI000461E685|nr:hypothetical protein [Fusobacterium necrophorum]KDE73920.1 hypothetical protein FUSO7_05480 [Fusobacterium necrophorum BFTR-2]